jgi:tRNA (cmo5U34)-methyltransferase
VNTDQSAAAPIPTSLGHQAGEKWAFDQDVTDCFEDMLRRSIPQYDVMRSAVTSLASSYAQPGTAIVDLGTSRGEALAQLYSELGVNNRYVGVDISEPMLKAARQTLASGIRAGLVSIEALDLRLGYPRYKNVSVVLSVLSLQFTPIEYRQRIVQDVYNSLLPGGAFIFVEKMLGADAKLDGIMVEQYYRMKADSGYPREEIERKRVALEGVLVPITARWNEDLLRQAGFRRVDCFWRWMNFGGFIALK